MGMQDLAKHQVLPANGFTSKAQAYLSNAYHHQMLQITPYNAAASSSLQPGGRSNNFDNIK